MRMACNPIPIQLSDQAINQRAVPSIDSFREGIQVSQAPRPNPLNEWQCVSPHQKAAEDCRSPRRLANVAVRQLSGAFSLEFQCPVDRVWYCAK